MDRRTSNQNGQTDRVKKKRKKQSQICKRGAKPEKLCFYRLLLGHTYTIINSRIVLFHVTNYCDRIKAFDLIDDLI